MTCERELSDRVIQWFCASYIDKVACGGTSQMFENWPLPSRPPSLCGDGKRFPGSASKGGGRGQAGCVQGFHLL